MVINEKHFNAFNGINMLRSKHGLKTRIGEETNLLYFSKIKIATIS